MSNTTALKDYGNTTQNLINSNLNFNSSGNTSAATLLLSNIIQNINDKENNLLLTQGLK
jgi:hypothetical protein